MKVDYIASDKFSVFQKFLMKMLLKDNCHFITSL